MPKITVALALAFVAVLYAQSSSTDLNTTRPSLPRQEPSVTFSKMSVTEASPSLPQNANPKDSSFTIFTYRWTNVGCDVNPGQVDEKEVQFRLPSKSCIRNSIKLGPDDCVPTDFCSYSVTQEHRNDNGDASYRVTEVMKDGIKLWYHCTGGFPVGGGGSDIKVEVVLKAIAPKGFPASWFGGCDVQAKRGNNAVACISAGSGQTSDIKSCFKGTGDCGRFTDITNMRCVADDDTAKWFRDTQCTPYHRDFVYEPNSPQCR